MSRGLGKTQRHILAELSYGTWVDGDVLELGVMEARLEDKGIGSSGTLEVFVTRSDQEGYQRALRSLVKSGQIEMSWDTAHTTPTGRPGNGRLRQYRVLGDHSSSRS